MTMWQALIPLIGSVIDKILPDPAAQADAKLKMLDMAQRGELAELNASTQLALGQIETNKVEAASDSLFKSGWRPAVGWACVGGLVYQVLARPVLGWVAQNLWGWTQPPSLEMETLMTLLFGMLGLGAYRTVERIKGAGK
jgi:hypothetical protein